MKRLWALKQGFTIIELLVAMAVIGILVSIMIVSYGGIQQRSRDSERNSDITLLKIAIEKYHAENSIYPAVCGGADVGCSVTNLDAALKPYVKTIPHDPKWTINTIDDYNYVTSTTGNDSYGLRVNYEARSDCKTGRNINANWWGSDIPSC